LAVVPLVVPFTSIDENGRIVLLSVKILPDIRVSCAWLIKNRQVKIKLHKKLFTLLPEFFMVRKWVFF